MKELAESGLGGVAVEPLAKRLGTTKGSFYWHFRSRDDLVVAALSLWEQEGTDSAISALEALPAGQPRLRRLFEAFFLTEPRDRAGETALAAGAADKALDLSIWLIPKPDQPHLTDVMTRVTERRVAYIAEQLVAMGFEDVEARNRAVLGYTAYLGFSLLSRSSPSAMPAGERAHRFVDSTLELITGRS